MMGEERISSGSASTAMRSTAVFVHDSTTLCLINLRVTRNYAMVMYTRIWSANVSVVVDMEICIRE